MKLKHFIILPAMMVLFFSSWGFSQIPGLPSTDDKIAAKKVTEKIIVFNYINESDRKNVDFYSSVIPKLLITDISIDNSYTVEIRDISPDIKSGIYAKDEFLRNDYFSKVAEQNGADFIVAGTYTTIKDTKLMSIKGYVFVNRSLIMERMSHMTPETGAMMVKTQGDLSKDLYAIIKSHKYVPAPPPAPAKPAPGVIKGFSFGGNYGFPFLMGYYKPAYQNTKLINAYILYDFYDRNEGSALEYFGISLEMNYFSGKTKSSWTKESKQYTLYDYGINLNPHLLLHIHRNFILDISAGPGFALLKKTSDSYSPYLNSYACFRATLWHITINAGVGYNMYFSKNILSTYYPFVGAGIRF